MTTIPLGSRIIRRYESYPVYPSGNECAWRYYIQTQARRWMFWGDLVWRDIAGPFQSKYEIEIHLSRIADEKNLGKEEIIS